MRRPPLVAVVGPTASGKTELALRLAERFDGEIVGADSRQVFRGLDIGTAKPAKEELARVPHHLVDVVAPDEPLGLARYVDLAGEALAGIWSRGRVPFLVGGTGQYVWALLEGWRVPRVPPQPELRRSLGRRIEREGVAALLAELRALDPDRAEAIDGKNPRRVVRALEVAMVRGPTDDVALRRDPPSWDVRMLAIGLPRDELFARIHDRVDAMLRAGFVDEVRRLRDAGYGDAFAMTGIGYREIGAYLDGRISVEEATERTKTATRRFARTQLGWFKRTDDRIVWLDPDRAFEEASKVVADLLSSQRVRSAG